MIAETLFGQPQIAADAESEILSYLLRGGYLTTKTCQVMFGTSELRHYISRIKRRGYGVSGEWVKVEVCGRKTRVKEFSIGE